MKPTAHSHCHPPSKLTHSAGCCCESMLQMSWAHSSISKQSIPLSLWNPEAHSQVKLPSVLRQLVTGFPCVVIRQNVRKLFYDFRNEKNVRKIISRRSPKMSVKCLLKLLQCQKCFQFSTFFSFGREKCQQWIWKYQKIDVEMSDNSHVVSLPKCLKKLVF